MQKFNEPIANEATGLPIANLKVLVQNYPAGTPAVVYGVNDNTTTPLVQPLTTQANGTCPFYAADGHYQIVTYPPGGQPAITDFILNDTNITFITALAAPSGSSLVGFIQAGFGAVLRFVQDKLRERVSPEDFGCLGDWNGTTGTDDTVNMQKALDYVALSRGKVEGTTGKAYRITATLNEPAGVLFVGHGGTSASSLLGSTLYHENPATPLVIQQARAVMRGWRVQVNNTNLVTPTVTPPTIQSISSYPTVDDIRFEYAYIGVGSPSGSTTGAFFIRNLSGFVHHRMVYLEGTKDISYVDNLHSQNPDGIAWDPSWDSYNNKVLVEINDADGLIGGNWYSYAGRGLFKQSGTGNLKNSITNGCAENITHGIEMASGSTNGHGTTFTGGYLSTNQRADGVYLVSNESAQGALTLLGMDGVNSANTDYIRVSAGWTIVDGGNWVGSPGSNAIRKLSGGQISVDNAVLKSHAYVLNIDNGATGVYFGAGNQIQLGGGDNFSNNASYIAGAQDITLPANYLDHTGALFQNIVRYTPAHGLYNYTSGEFLVHQQNATAVGQGASIIASASNNNGAHIIGAKVKMSAWNTGANPGGEYATMRLYAYSNGAYGNAIELKETGYLWPTVNNSQALGDSTKKWSNVYSGIINSDQYKNGSVLIFNSTNPTIESGFGTSPSIVKANGNIAFQVNVGTGGTASSGVLTLPAAANGWMLSIAPSGAPQAGAETLSVVTSTTQCTITNYTLSTGVALAWPSGTILNVKAVAF